MSFTGASDVTLLVIVATTFLIASRTRPVPDRTVLVVFAAIAVATYYPNEGGILYYTIARFDVRDLLLFSVCAMLLWDTAVGRRRSASVWVVPAAAFYVTVLISVVASWIAGDIAVVRASRDFRPLLFMSFTVLVPAIVTSRERLTALVRCLTIYSVIILALTPLQIMLATKGAILLPGFQPTPDAGSFFLFGWSYAGHSLANAFVYVALYRLMSGHPFSGGRLFTAGVVLAGTATVAMGLKRMGWISLGAAILMSLLLLPLRVKVRFAGALLGVTAGIALVVSVAVAATPAVSARAVAWAQFLSSMLDPAEYRNTAETGERTSIGRRLMENQLAWDVFTRNPILGAGLGYKYWNDVELFTPEGGRVSLRKIHISGGSYIHNAWLWLLSKIGLLGTLTFVIFILPPFLRGLLRLDRIPEPNDRAVVFGFSLYAVALLTEAVGNPIFFNVTSAAGLGVMAGVVLAAFKISKDRASDATSIDHHSVLQRRAWHSLPLRAA